MSIARKVISMIGAFLISFGVVFGCLLLMMFIAGQVLADDTKRTYPARLGEQDRSLNGVYQAPMIDVNGYALEADILTDQAYAMMEEAEDALIEVEVYISVEKHNRCDKRNYKMMRFILTMLENTGEEAWDMKSGLESIRLYAANFCIDE